MEKTLQPQERGGDYKRVPLPILLMFCGYVITWYLQVGERWPAFGAVRIEFMYGIALIALMPFIGIPFSSPLVKFILFYLAMVVIQIPLSHAVDHSLQVFWNRVVKFGFLGVFIATFVKSPRDLRWFVVATMLAWAKMGQEGLYGVLSGGMMWENQGILRLHGSTSLYHHPNSYSGFAVGVLPFVYFLFPAVNKIAKIGLLAMAAFSINIILFTGSRTGYVAVAVFVTFLFIRSRRKLLWSALAIPLLITGIVLAPVEYKQRFMTIFTLQEAEGNSAETRIQILSDAWQVFVKHPQGVGVGAFPVVRHKMFNRIQDTHNLYLEVATNLGIQGFVAFAFFIGALLWMLRSNYLDFQGQWEVLRPGRGQSWRDESTGVLFKKHMKDLHFLKAMSSAMLAFVIVRLALGMFGMDLYEIYWWFASGTAVAMYAMREVTQDRTVELAEKIDVVTVRRERDGGETIFTTN